MSKKILITGGTGFVGSHLIELLSKEEPGATLHSTTFKAVDSYVSANFPEVTQHSLNLTDKQATFELISTVMPDELYHLASISAVGSSFENVRDILHNNLTLHLNVLEAVKECSPDTKMLSVGSAECYGQSNLKFLTPLDETALPLPTNPYSISKLTQEMLSLYYARSYKLNIVCARPFNHVGERQTPNFAVSAFASQIAAIELGLQSHLSVGNLETVRDFSDVKDIVRGYSTLMSVGQGSQIYNLGSGKGYRIQDILNKLISLARVEIKVESDPKRMRPSDTAWLLADIGKIKSLGWSPKIEIMNTLERTLEYWRDQKSLLVEKK